MRESPQMAGAPDALSGQTARRGTRRAWLGYLALFSIAVACAVLAQGPGWNQNGHYALVRGLANGTPTIDRTRFETGDWYVTGDISLNRGHVYSNKAPGFAFAVLPAYLAMRSVGKAHPAGDQTGQLWFLGLWGSVLPALVLLLLVRRVADEFEPGFGTAAAVTLGLGTLVLPFSTLFFSHLLSVMLVFSAFAVLWYEGKGAPRQVWIAAAGFLVGYAMTTEFQNAIVAGALGCYVLTRAGRLKRALAYGGGAILGLVPLLAYNQWAFGSPLHLSYQSTVGFGPTGTFFLRAPTFRRAVEVLFASSSDTTQSTGPSASSAPIGLLTASPVLALGAVGTLLLYRRGRRREALLIGGVAVAYLLFEASFEYPFGGASPGPRYLIPMLPFLALPLAAAYRRLPVTTLALAAPSVVVMVAATATHPMYAFDGQWLRRFGDGDFSATVLSLFGSNTLDSLKLASSTTWHPMLLFLIPVVSALAFAVAGRPRVSVSLQDLLSGAACLLGWFVLQREAPRWLAGNGVGRQWGPVAVVLLAIAVAAIPIALSYVLRASPAALVEQELPRE